MNCHEDLRDYINSKTHRYEDKIQLVKEINQRDTAGRTPIFYALC